MGRRGHDYEADMLAQVLYHRLPVPDREFRFHPKRKWRFDFAWPEQKIALEVEGATWVQGRHTRGSGFEKDAEKYNEAALLGWKVLRATGGMVVRGQAIEYVRRALAAPAAT